MKTRVIHTKIWKDQYFFTLNDKESKVFLFLLTNDSINMCGIYELNDEEIKLWCHVSTEELQQIKDKFVRDNRFLFKNGWVGVINHKKYNTYGKGNLQEKAYTREISLIPKDVKMVFNTSMDTSNCILDINHKSETINNKSYIKDHNSEDIGEGYVKFLETKEKLTKLKTI